MRLVAKVSTISRVLNFIAIDLQLYKMFEIMRVSFLGTLCIYRHTHNSNHRVMALNYKLQFSICSSSSSSSSRNIYTRRSKTKSNSH